MECQAESTSSTHFNILQNILQSYDGPFLIERLYHLYKAASDSEVAIQSALCCLKLMEQYGVLSPFYKELVSKLESQTDPSSYLPYISKEFYEQVKSKTKETIYDLARNLESKRDIVSDDDIKVASSRLSSIYSIQHEFQLAIDSLNLSPSNKYGYFCSDTFYSTQIAFFKRNFSQVPRYSKKVDNFLTQVEASDQLKSKFTPPEVTMYWKVKWLTLAAKFCLNEHQEVSDEFLRLLHSDSIFGISAVDVLNSDSFKKIVNKKEILTMAMLSLIVATPSKSLIELMDDEMIESYCDDFPEIRNLFYSLYETDFCLMNSILDSFETPIASNVLIAPSWQYIRLILRQKSYLIYLSMIKSVSSTHMASTLGVSSETIVTEVIELANILDLTISYDCIESVFSYAPDDPKNDMLQLIDDLTTNLDVSSRALSVYSLLTKSLISQKQ